ncbi:MAG: hypothetical protein U1F26_10495 [Lysobacterales bacterium]
MLLLLCLGIGLVWAFVNARDAIQPRNPAGFRAALTWASVSNGETDANVGLRYFSMQQVNALSARFPEFGLIAASPPSEEEVAYAGQDLHARVQFIKPDSFLVAGVRLNGSPLKLSDSQVCVASERWVERTEVALAASIEIAGVGFELRASVDPTVRMLGGSEVVDLWCSWDAVARVLPGATSTSESQPLFWVFVGFKDANQHAQWMQETREIELPRAFMAGNSPHSLLTMEGWTPHPRLQQEALARLALLQGMGATFVLLGVVLVCFSAAHHVRRHALEQSIRNALGARVQTLVISSAISHVCTLILALPPAWLLARVLFALLWQDPQLSQAQFSGTSIDGAGLWPALVTGIVACAISFATEAIGIVRQARAPRLDVSSKSALAGLRQGRVAGGLLAAFTCFSCWVSIAQLQHTTIPAPQRFGLDRPLVVLEPIFPMRTPISQRVLAPEAMQMIESLPAIAGSVAFVESFPARSSLAFPAELLTDAGTSCGASSELLRGSTSLPRVLGIRFRLGRAPAMDEIAISATRARRCFGSESDALGKRLTVDGIMLPISGVYADMDWSLGRGTASEFIASSTTQAFAWFAVAADTAAAARASSVLELEVREQRPALKEIRQVTLAEILQKSWHDEASLARLLSALALVLSVAAGLAAGGLYSAVVASQRGALALHLALGATRLGLAVRVARGILWTAAPACALSILITAALAGASLAINALVDGSGYAALLAMGTCTVLMLLIAAHRVFKALAAPDLGRELAGS